MSEFVKLDCGILDSTVWPDRDLRDVFITALLMAKPREYMAPVRQLDPVTFQETGWEAPPGWYGFVNAFDGALLARARVDEVPGLKAIAKMGEPELRSKSRAFDGRRMIIVDGGFVILNYDRYRQRDSTCAERAKRYRETHVKTNVSKPRKKPSQRVTRDERDVTRYVTQVEGDAEVEAEVEAEGKENIKSDARDTQPGPVADPSSGTPPQSATLPPVGSVHEGSATSGPREAKTPHSGKLGQPNPMLAAMAGGHDSEGNKLPSREQDALLLFEAYKKATGRMGAKLDWRRKEFYLQLHDDGVTAEDISMAIGGAKLDPWAVNQKLAERPIIGSASQREKYIAMYKDPPKPKTGQRTGPQPNDERNRYKPPVYGEENNE